MLGLAGSMIPAVFFSGSGCLLPLFVQNPLRRFHGLPERFLVAFFQFPQVA